MSYKEKHLCKIRTITTFLSLDKHRETWSATIRSATQFCHQLAGVFAEHNYDVQSIRIVTNPFGEYLNTQNIQSAKEDLAYLSDLLNTFNTDHDLRIRFAIGEAKTEHEISLLPELIAEYGDLCNACVNIALDDNQVLDYSQIMHCAKAVEKISRLTPRGEGNFNFTVNVNCDPLIPYFPASYHQSSLGNRFVIGLETPDLLVHVLKTLNETQGDNVSHHSLMPKCYQVMHEALQYHIDTIGQIVLDEVNHKEVLKGFQFSGFDSSAAPSKDCASMVDVYRELGVEYFGASGTVEASALLTRVFKSISGFDLVGFSGLMLALTEDTGLAQGSINEQFDIRALLTYSAVCGIGLDTVPIPGNTSVEKIAALICDTGTMAYRLQKPLTVRVFPVPGLSAGEITAFESDDLCNCAVLAVP